MKLALFICISLFASLLHAAAMPIANMGDTPMTPEVEMVGQHSPEQHVKMGLLCDHHSVEDHCSDNDHSGCLSMALQPDLPSLITLPYNGEIYASLSSCPPRLKPDTLYRPPKFYPF